ncbi:fimbrial protein [Oceanisphaera sp. KMM 10153]|uniref:fimbrial protein n=1 Tax=Oceanisphaera submarina TaxID=3390193 RepID=UPI00397481E9
MEQPPAACGIRYDSGASVALGSLAPSAFPAVGSRSPLRPFTWSAGCEVAGDATAVRQVDVTYGSLTSITDAENGRTAVQAGGATGLEFEVVRGVSGASPEGTPVRFGTALNLGATSTAAPVNLVENMGVRLVRTGEIGEGPTEGGITINLTYR